MKNRYNLCLWVLPLFFVLGPILLSSCVPAPSISNRRFIKNKVVIGGVTPGPVPTTQRPSDTSPEDLSLAQLSLKEVGVLLTLVDDNTGAAVNVTHVIGEGNLDLSGVSDGTYTLLAETIISGFRPPPPQTIEVKNGKFGQVDLRFEKIKTDHFYYYWESDHQGREFEYSANDKVAPKIEFLDEVVEPSQTTAAQMLQKDYNIILNNTETIQWSYDLAAKLLRAVDFLPHKRLRKHAKFSLTRRELLNDIAFEQEDGHYKVEVNLDAFAYASEKLVKLNGKRGKFFSRRLFNALVHFITDNGKRPDAVAKILEDKFAVTTKIKNYYQLTGEGAGNFQKFKSNELIKLINALAEMPEGFYKIQGLRYLVRRLDGHPHPLYPEAAAVAWPRGSDVDSYIEFMDVAFISQSESYTHRLILHEKTHFLWSNLFSQELREDWIEVGNWFENPEATSGWSTTDTASFVSAYAHAKNPNEDMAESIATYVLNPNRLLSRSSKKFDFIERRIMNGYRYVSSIREDLTFEVFNLFPDYDYPGKIRRVEVEAKGDGTQDKKVSITIELTNKEGVKDSATHAFTRVSSPIDETLESSTFKDVYLYPVNGNGHLLRGTFTIPDTAKNGYWTIQNISVTDANDNERYEGIIDFGFKLFINNIVEDKIPPAYVAESLTMETTERERNDGRQVFEIDIQWEIDENLAMDTWHPTYANMISLDHTHLYRTGSYGLFNEENGLANVRITLTEHHPAGRYGISYINMKDRALNYGRQYFSENPESDPDHEMIEYVTINPQDPDMIKPVLDPNRITVQADPIHPEAPDGSTNVQITFYAKDDKSGLGVVHYLLMDPLGGTHSNYFYHENFYTLFYKGDPTQYREYNVRLTLPKGSPPGQWGLFEVILHDKAGNTNTYNFLETIHFDLE